MIVKLKCVAVYETCGFSEGNAAGTLPALPVLVLHRHYLIRKIALIHVKVETIHGDELDEGYIIRLAFCISNVIAKHESSTFGCMCVKIDIHS